jgi:hypothetical protein
MPRYTPNIALSIALLCLTILPTLAATPHPTRPRKSPPLTQADRDALELGRKILAAQAAIKNPAAPGSMKAITDLGHDQRYYVMTRGWLAYQLQADQSIRSARKDRTPKAITDRIAFLKKAMRRLDME